MKILYSLLRKSMIKRMLNAGWKEKRINSVLAAFDLPQIKNLKKYPPSFFVETKTPLKDIFDEYGTIPDEIYPCQ